MVAPIPIAISTTASVKPVSPRSAFVAEPVHLVARMVDELPELVLHRAPEMPVLCPWVGSAHGHKLTPPERLSE